MEFQFSATDLAWRDRVKTFIDNRVRPRCSEFDAHVAGAARWTPVPLIEDLKAEARAAGLWNLFMPPPPGHAMVDSAIAFDGPGLTNLQYALCAEEMGRVLWAAEVFNCSAPDSGNMEVLHRYGTRAQKERWLLPLMHGEARSAFLMTEPAVASSDATNITTRIVRNGDDYVISGRKWWSSGVGDPRCAFAIVMGKTDPAAAPHLQQAMIVVPLAAPGVKVERLLSVLGYDDAPHGHAQVLLDAVRVPADHLLLGEGRGFEIAQGRLGPGRIHHCMRTIGLAEEALELMVRRLLSRTAFGRPIAEHSVWEERIAEARIAIESTRLLCLKAADTMDRLGNKAAALEIALIKVAGPRMAIKLVDDAIQAHGGAGLSDDVPLARFYANVRALRIADGPDEVHNRTIARMEFRKYR